MVKVVAFDVYGTILASDDHDDCFPPRQSLELLLDECRKREIIPVTSSDAYIPSLKSDLSATFSRYPDRGLSLESFSNFFCLNQPYAKDYSLITGFYRILPEELLVIDDRDENIESAQFLGCNTIMCPEYSIDGGREWDFSMIDLDSF